MVRFFKNGKYIKRSEGQHRIETLQGEGPSRNLSWYPLTWPGRNISSRDYYQVKHAFWTALTIVLLQFVLVPSLASTLMGCVFDCCWNAFVNGYRNASHYDLGNDTVDPSLILHERPELRKLLRRDILPICLTVGTICVVGITSVLHIGLFVTGRDWLAKSRKLNLLYAVFGTLLIILTGEKISSTVRLQHENYPQAYNSLKLIIQNADYSSDIIDSAKFLQLLLYSCLKFTDEEAIPMPEMNLKNLTRNALILESHDYAKKIGICQSAYLNFVSSILTFILAVVCLMVPVVSVATRAPVQIGVGRLTKLSNTNRCPYQCPQPPENNEILITNDTKNKMLSAYAPTYPPIPYVSNF